MIICTDPREKTPLTFKNYDVTVVRGRFETGYTMPGHEKEVAVLRWSLRGLTSVHAGFERRCKRIARLPYSAVVFENWNETPDEVRQAYVDSMNACDMRFHFGHDSETYIYNFLTSYLRRTGR